MALLPPFFLDCVASIGIEDSNKHMSWIGTGFFYGFPGSKGENDEQLYFVYLVTNKHVIGNHSKVKVRLNPQDGQDCRDFDLVLLDTNNKQLWRAHSDPTIDLAVIQVSPQFMRDQKLQYSFFSDDRHVSALEDIKKGGLNEGDPVFVLGFPMGNVGAQRLYAICRSGIVARCRDWIEGHSKEILIDSSVFPGNSGGPVVASFYASSVQGTERRNKSDLIGIIQSYVTYHDIAISQQTHRPRVIFEENSGLASVIPVDFLRDIVREMHTQKQLPFEETKPVITDSPT